MKQSRLLTTKELCEKVKVDRTTVWRWRKEGLPVVKLNKSIRFDEFKTMMWLDMKGSNKVIKFFKDVTAEMKSYVKIELDGKETIHEFNNMIQAVTFISKEEPKLPPEAKISIANDFTIAKAEMLDEQ